MGKIVKYVMLDILKSNIVLAYTALLLLISFGVFNLEDNAAKGTLSLLNVILIIVPMVSLVFATIYVYNSAEFIELLLSQPIRRQSLMLSVYSGLAISLVIALLVGVGIPVMLYDGSATGILLVVTGVLLSVIFVSIALLIGVVFRDKAKGIGAAILVWFYFAVVFDGIILFILFQFQDYPMEKISIALVSLNPVDLGRILVMLKMDISAMMGYTGAVFKEFLGGVYGSVYICAVMALWVVVPMVLAIRKFKRKDL
jgi:Cu-processing system permease protein